MKSLDIYTALQVTISIALISILIISLYAVAYHALSVENYKVMLLSSVITATAQVLIEALRNKQVINI